MPNAPMCALELKALGQLEGAHRCRYKRRRARHHRSGCGVVAEPAALSLGAGAASFNPSFVRAPQATHGLRPGATYLLEPCVFFLLNL
jgi:hypothetical protein